MVPWLQEGRVNKYVFIRFFKAHIFVRQIIALLDHLWLVDRQSVYHLVDVALLVQ